MCERQGRHEISYIIGQPKLLKSAAKPTPVASYGPGVRHEVLSHWGGRSHAKEVHGGNFGLFGIGVCLGESGDMSSSAKAQLITQYGFVVEGNDQEAWVVPISIHIVCLLPLQFPTSANILLKFGGEASF